MPVIISSLSSQKKSVHEISSLNTSLIQAKDISSIRVSVFPSTISRNTWWPSEKKLRPSAKKIRRVSNGVSSRRRRSGVAMVVVSRWMSNPQPTVDWLHSPSLFISDSVILMWFLDATGRMAFRKELKMILCHLWKNGGQSADDVKRSVNVF